MLQLTFHCCKVEGFKQDTRLGLYLLHAMVCALIFLAQWQQQQRNLELAAKKRGGERERKDEGKGNMLSN